MVGCLIGKRFNSKNDQELQIFPTPINVATLGSTDNPNCKLCGRSASLITHHFVLTFNRFDRLSDRLYIWRYDTVLSVLADVLDRRLIG
jgi:hypothetical protein